MNDNNESAWSVVWWILFYPTLLVALPMACQELGWAGAGSVLGALAFELFMLALPSLWQEWERRRPQRERARIEARARRAERDRMRAEHVEARQRKRAEERARRDARVAEARARRGALAARQEVEAYYRVNAALLADVLPPSLFRAEVAATFAVDIAPEEAWQAAHDLISRMQPPIRQAQERRREVDERVSRRGEQLRDIDNQIRAHEARIASVRASAFDADMIEDEIAAERQFIERLREQRAALQSER